jgi:tetratricopeptide (TPR) repeat protein
MELAIGKVYLEIVKGEKQVSMKLIAKNLGFILKHALSAPKKAESHLKMAVSTTDKLGAKSLKAGAHRDLGTLYRIKKQQDQSREHLEKAIQIYEEIGASIFLEQTEQELLSIH